MKRPAWMLLGWSCGLLAAGTLVSSADAVELRGRSGPRATHRLAALQVDEPLPLGGDEEGELAPEEAMPAPRPSRAPAHPIQPSRAAPRATMAMPEAHWEAPVMHDEAGHGGFGPGGPCSEGYCEECPTDVGVGCYGAWGSVEYVLFWREQRRTPTLLTTTTTIINQDTDGQLGQANTRTLLGPNSFDDHLQPGGRFDLGFWLDQSHSFGLGFRFTGLGDDELNYVTNSNVNSVLAVPFFNLDPGVNSEDTLLVAHPLDGTTGNVRVTGHNEVYLGDFYMRLCGARTDRYRMDVIGGYMFSRINDDLTLRTATTTGATEIVVRDRFRTKNQYHAGMIGVMGEVDRGAWKVNMLAKVGLGNVEQTSIVDGITTIGGTPQGPLSGLFTQQSNIGTLVREEFAVVPEFNINWVYKVGCRTELSAGYSAIYWSEAALAGEQINRRVDPTQTTARPAGAIVAGDYFVQGLTFGLNWQY